MNTLARLLILALAAIPAFAEQLIVVQDHSGRALGDVAITVTDPEGNTTVVISDELGQAFVDAEPSSSVVVTHDRYATVATTLRPGTTTVRLLSPIHNDTIVVSAGHSRVPLSEVSSAVTVIGGERLQEELRTSTTLADVLGKLVPGLAPGNGSSSIYGQTIRGRGIQVLVDGVPLTTLRNVARDLVAIDPASVQRIEVLRGSSAMYGDGATGGLINIITAAPADGAFAMETDVASSVSLTHPGSSATGRLSQSLSGRHGTIDWTVKGSMEQTGAYFDADGDRIAPDPYGQGGPAETGSVALLGKIGWAPTDTRRLQLSIQTFDSEQDTDWTSDPAVNSLPPLSAKSRAIKGLDMDHPQGTENKMVQLSYEDRAPLNSRLHAQVYARDYLTVFTPYDGRSLPVYGRKIFQSRLESESVGARLDLETPLPNQMTMFWGFDAGSEKTAQPAWLMDPSIYDESGGRTFRTIGDRTFVPLIDKKNGAAFAQLEWLASERWLIRAGVRHENVIADVPTFMTLADATIQGGERDWADTLFNTGVVFYLTPQQRVWSSFSQGFSLPDIGLVLRSAPAGSTLDTLPFQPQIVDAWEIGWSHEGSVWMSEIATFYNTSEFGTSTAGFNQPVVRAPERVYGVEGAFEVDPAGPWSTRLNAAWNEGKSDPDRDGDYTWLNAYRISPPNATFSVSHQTSARWRNRLSVSWSGSRNRFAGSTAFGQRPIDSYTVVDLFSSVRMLGGDLQVGVRNLLNEEYFVRDAQLLRSGFNNSHSAAPGATLELGWSIRY